METNREFLKHSTRTIHDELDSYMQDVDFGNASVYRRLLEANHAPLKRLEALIAAHRGIQALPGWSFSPRLGALEADLEDLGGVLAAEDSASQEELEADELLGIIYVLEGSRLGGRMLIRAFQAEQPALRTMASRFFSSGEGDWKRFVTLFDSRLASQELLLQGSQRAFNEFLVSFRRCFGGSREVTTGAVRPTEGIRDV